MNMNSDALVDYYTRLGIALQFMPVAHIEKAFNLLTVAKARGSKVYLIGNGGSATTAMHFANDLQKMCGIDSVALPAQTATILAYGNDDGWENMFTNYLIEIYKDGDILVAFSCSGRSENILRAVDWVNSVRGLVIGFTGLVSEFNELSQRKAIIISVKDNDIKIQEDVHFAICHSLAGALMK